MKTATKQQWTHKVVKTQRGSDGQWFRYAGRAFASLDEAVTYAEQFAGDQTGVSGTRILVVARKGGGIVRDIKTTATA